jgi:RHS repeat-associated protein
MSQNPAWAGHRIQRFRLDPTNAAGASFAVDWIRTSEPVSSYRAVAVGINPDLFQLFASDVDAYGLQRRELYKAASETEPHGYTGQEEESDLGLYHYGARLYLPELGRFLAVDPAREFANSYSYVGNNPLRFTDQDGKSSDIFGAAIFSAQVIARIFAIRQEMASAGMPEDQINSFFAQGGIESGNGKYRPYNDSQFVKELISPEGISFTISGAWITAFGGKGGLEFVWFFPSKVLDRESETLGDIAIFWFDSFSHASSEKFGMPRPMNQLGINVGVNASVNLISVHPDAEKKFLDENRLLSNAYTEHFWGGEFGPASVFGGGGFWGGGLTPLTALGPKGLIGVSCGEVYYYQIYSWQNSGQ